MQPYKANRYTLQIAIIKCFLASFSVVFSGFFFGYYFLSNASPPGYFSYAFGQDSLFIRLARNWDASWYYSIATIGYSKLSAASLLKESPTFNTLYHGYTLPANVHTTNLAFFPAFPYLLRLANLLTGGWHPYNGVILATTFFILSIIAYYKLSLEVGAEARAADRATLLYSVYPGALFCFSAYPTSLLNFLIFSSLLYYKRKRFLLSAFFCGMATSAGPLGIFLAFGMLVSSLNTFLRERNFQVKKWRDIFTILRDSKIIIAKGAFNSLVSISGIVAFMALLYIKFGDPLIFVKAQSAWEIGTVLQHVINLLTFKWVHYEYAKSLYDAILFSFHGPIYELDFIVENCINTIYILLLLYIVITTIKRQSHIINVFSIAVFIYYIYGHASAVGTSASGIRLLYVITPLFIQAASTENLSLITTKLKYIFMATLFIQSAFFVSGHLVI